MREWLYKNTMPSYHFYQRVTAHAPHLAAREGEVKKAIARATRAEHVAVHDSHVHVFLQASDQKKGDVVAALRRELDSLEGVRWSGESYLDPIQRLSKKDIRQLLEELHR